MSKIDSEISQGTSVNVEVENIACEEPQLKKSINLWDSTAIMLAVTGHASIFISTASILSASGSIGASLILWLIGGLINMGLALCFAELGTMIPEAGGPYAYVQKTFGPLPGFLILWSYTVLIVGPFWAFLAYTAALYMVKPVFPDCQNSATIDLAIKLLAGWIMVALVLLNSVYMNCVMKVQTFLSVTKVLALVIIIFSGFYKIATGHTSQFPHMFENTSQKPGDWALAIFYSIFSYGGWQVLASLMEEMVNPARDTPLSVYMTFFIVITKYLLTNVAYFTLLTPDDLMNSEAVALLYINKLYRPLSVPIAAFVATTAIGALNASVLGHSRLLFAGARYGHMPDIIGMIHVESNTPLPALILALVLSLAMLFSGGLTRMMEFISVCSTIIAMGVILAIFYLRYTQPKAERPYKTMWFVPVTEFMVNILVLVLAIHRKPSNMGIAVAVFFLGIPVYWVGVVWKKKPRAYFVVVGGLNLFAQKLLLIVKSQ